VIAVSRTDLPRLSEWLSDALPGLVPEWLPAQRWYGGKSMTIAQVVVADVMWIGPRTALTLIDVQYAGRLPTADRYVLLLGLEPAADATAIARVPWDRSVCLIESATRPESVGDVLDVLAGGARPTGARGGVLAAADVEPAALPQPMRAGRPLDVKAIGLEQSNTSVRIGRSHALKIIRRIQPGEHPQLEIERFLTRAGFESAPRLEGSLTYVAANGDRYAVAALEAWVDNQGDGWTFVLDALRTAHREGVSRALLHALFTLGRVTGGFHAALAGGTPLPDFAPESVSYSDVADWKQRVISQGERLIEKLASLHSTGDAGTSAAARQLVERRHRIRTVVGGLDLDRQATAVKRIRVHGDYHLGQTLKTSSGFVLIDFEGEPSRSLQERRRKDCALRDVAGMLRSIDYAAASSATGDGASARAAVTPMRDAFLDGYYADARTGDFLPSRQHGGPWLSLFELEKALYEVDYELNNRPAWLPIPLAAVLRFVEQPA
jgi:maltose alpha-D-glucosyltransferase/alpha-amylase